MDMNALRLLAIVLVSLAVGIVVGFFLAGWYLLRKIKKATGVKSWKEFAQQVKKAHELQKKMEKMANPFEMMNDPEVRKQMEELRKRFSEK